MSDSPPEIRIKLLAKSSRDGERWLRMFPRREPVWGNCRFVLDRACREYDWLVVYDDLPPAAGERRTLGEEALACPGENTLLVTTEPSTVKVYGRRYLRQFRWVLTSQAVWATGRHPGRIFAQPGLVWFYAGSARGEYDAIARDVPLRKTRQISTVCSAKRQRHTLHRRRFAFTMALKARVPELDVFGHGVRPLGDKADALDPYRYHVVVENFAGAHHWTEKLADAFLGACLPLYHGCPNLADYFPEESFLRLDIGDVEAAAETIARAVRDGAYERSRAAILESRRLVLERYGPIATISRLVAERHRGADPLPAAPGAVVRSRRRVHRRGPAAARYLLEKLYVRGRHGLGPRGGA